MMMLQFIFQKNFMVELWEQKNILFLILKKSQFVASTVDAPSKDYLSKYTNLKLKRVKEDA
jgi:hypothetical protein